MDSRTKPAEFHTKIPPACVLDIDGVLTDGTALLSTSGEEVKRIAFHDLDAVTRAQAERIESGPGERGKRTTGAGAGQALWSGRGGKRRQG